MKKALQNRKILLGIISLLLAIAVIVVTSFWPFIFDPNNLKPTFLTDELIIISITIFGMIATLFIGQAGNAQNPASELAKAIVKFNETVKLVTNRNAFKQWIKKVFQPNDLQSIKIRKLRNLGIENNNYLELTIPQIKALKDTPQKYDGVFYKSLTSSQVKGLISIKKNKKQITLVEPEYYLTFKNVESNKTISEKSGNESKKKISVVSLDLLGKIILTLLTAVVLGSLVYDATVGAGGVQAAMNFFSRIWALMSSSFLGYTVGTKINDIDADYIRMRSEVHIQFSEDKTFKPLTEEEEAKEEFKKRVLKEEHALLENKSTQIEMKTGD